MPWYLCTALSLLSLPAIRKDCRATGGFFFFHKTEGTAIAQWSRYCATNRKVAGSIPRGTIGIFH